MTALLGPRSPVDSFTIELAALCRERAAWLASCNDGLASCVAYSHTGCGASWTRLREVGRSTLQRTALEFVGREEAGFLAYALPEVEADVASACRVCRVTAGRSAAEAAIRVR